MVNIVNTLFIYEVIKAKRIYPLMDQPSLWLKRAIKCHIISQKLFRKIKHDMMSYLKSLMNKT